MLLLALASGPRAFAQEPEEEAERTTSSEAEEEEAWSPWFFRFAYEPSFVLQSNDFVQGENLGGAPIDRAQAFKVELGWQTDGTSDWAQRYRLPALGVGVYGASFRNGDELGTPVAVYGWYSWPWATLGDRLELTNDFGLGAAFGWNRFDPEGNPFNRAISTSVTFYTEWGLYLRYALTDRMDFTAGAVFHHFSNGGTGDPNAAINMLAPHLGLRYDLAPGRPRYTPRELPEARPAWELSAFGGNGAKTVDLGVPDEEGGEAPYDPQRFGVAAFSVDLHRVVHPMFRVGGGVDVIYDGSANAGLSEEPTSSDKTAVGLFGGYEHAIGRFSIPVQVGYYVWRGRDDERLPSFYQKLGFQYDLTSRIFAGMNVRFYDFSRADFFTWTIGFRWTRPDTPAEADEVSRRSH